MTSDTCSKLREALKNIKKTLECNICHKLPNDPVSAKCGHLFCQNCVNKIVNTKKGVCGVCKIIIIRSGLSKAESSRKIVADYKALCEANEKDVSALTPEPRQYTSRRKNLSLPGASSVGTDTSKSGPSTIKRIEHRGEGSKKTRGKASVLSEETIKLNPTNSKRTDPPPRLEPVRRNTDRNSPVFTTDELSSEIGAIGSTEKVKGWLFSESFEEETCDPSGFPEIQNRPASPTSSESLDLDSFSQAVTESKKISERRAASTQREMKGKSKAPELTNSEDFFEKVQSDRTDEGKTKIGSKQTESSWSELKQLKKETRPNIRKRKKLNVSIERPSSSKPGVESLDKDDSEDEDCRNRKRDDSDELTESAKKRAMPYIVCTRKLDKSERFPIDIEKLNKHQVKKIIGVVDSDISKNSTGSLEKSLDKSNASKLSLRKSLDNSKNKSNNEEGTSRPESRQSLQPNDTRPESRLSDKSLGKQNSNKFRLSTKISSPSTPNASPAKESVDQITPREEVKERIEVHKKSPLKTSNDIIRSKLSLRRGSSGSSKTTESRVLSITKLGKLYKPKNRIKFYRRGSILSRFEKTELSRAVSTLRGSIDTRDAQTQTNPQELEGPNEDLEACEAIAQPSTVSTISKIPSEELDTVNKVNIMSPRDDSQLKYLATESPTVLRIGILESEQSARRMNDVSKTTGEFSLVSSGTQDFTKKVQKYAEKLIVTDSEDQDTPIVDLGRKKIEKTEKTKPPIAENRENEVETAPKRAKSVQKSPSVHSGRNSSPMTTKLSGSQSKRRRTEKPKSPDEYDAETVIISRAKSKDGSCQGDSELVLSTAKHKVVRKLDYSQESRSTRTSEPGQSGSTDKGKKRRSPDKKTFRKAQLISSSDSDDDFMNISLSTKKSSSNSLPIARPGVSQACGNIILTENMSLEFPSNRETVDGKRKRSPSPNSLDNNDIQAIAAGWCDEMNQTSQEIADDNNAVFGKSRDNGSVKSPAPLKKPRIDSQASSLSLGSDQFPALSPTAIYGSKKKSDNPERPLSFKGKITPAKNVIAESTPTNNFAKRGNTFNGRVATSKNATPTKSRSLEDRETRVLLHNSDKENELGKVSQMVTRGDSKKSKENVDKDSPNYTDTFEYSNLNITQEQLLMQEIEDNLLGRNTNSIKHKETQDNKIPDQSSIVNKEKTPTRRDKLRPNGYQTAQIEYEDSANVSDEDIIASTPEKNLLPKKDLSTHVDYSQRSNASLKSFMSVDMTPIPNRGPKILQIGSDVSPLVERNSRLSSNQESLHARIASHSTPKTVVPSTSKSVASSPRFCFVCSCLTLPQVQNVKAFARQHNAEYTASYKPEVTHIIVETNEADTASRTVKYLLGVAHKKWIVSYRWVVDCMSEGRLLPEDAYEAVDSEEEPGPRRSRLSEKGLFDQFAFACMEPFSDITISQLKDLITSCGGIVIESLEGLAALDGKYKFILYNGDVHQPEVLANWQSRGCALPVQVEWALFCVSQYQLISVRDYYESSDPDFVLHMGFPPELINEEEDDSTNEASTLQNN